MDKKILFQKKADVMTAHGKTIGSLERVVLNPETKVITDVVVRTGTIFDREDKVVPIDLVAETTDYHVLLRDKAGELDAFPPFEERHLVDANAETDQPPEKVAPVVYGYPELGPSVLPAPGEEFVTQIEQNIPEGTVAMKEGAKVITIEGEHVGNVERVLADSSVDQVTHLLISRGLFMKETKLIPISWVMMLGEDNVHLRVKKDSVEELGNTPIAV
jgi:uncharacterized protein YrrD